MRGIGLKNSKGKDNIIVNHANRDSDRVSEKLSAFGNILHANNNPMPLIIQRMAVKLHTLIIMDALPYCLLCMYM